MGSNEDGSGGGASVDAAVNEPSFVGIGGGGRNESLLACPPAEGSGGGGRKESLFVGAAVFLGFGGYRVGGGDKGGERERES